MDYKFLILGSDANAYYMGRCFHEKYNVKPYILAKEPMSFIHHSNLFNITYDNKIWEEKYFVEAINNFASKFKCKIVVVSSNETFARFLVQNKDKLKKNLLFNYPNLDLLYNLIMKDKFYEAFGNSGLLPDTIIYSVNDKLPKINITYPLIIKPCDVIEYNHIKFEGKKKIYKLDNLNEVKETISSIKNGGYTGNLIIQEYIPGDDSSLFDIALYSNTLGKVEYMTFAQIGLQEHKSTMVGNAACLINGFSTFGFNEKQILKFKNFIEKIGLTGLAEIDIKYDYRDKKYKILEINARQGRCGYYMCACGYNPCEYLINDLIYNKHKDFVLVKEEVLLSFVPKGIIKKYVVNDEFKKKALSMKRINPLLYKKDLGLKRRLFLIKKDFNYYKDYKNGYWKY